MAVPLGRIIEHHQCKVPRISALRHESDLRLDRYHHAWRYKQLSVDVNTSNQKPAEALITQPVALSATVEYNGWVGFSGSSVWLIGGVYISELAVINRYGGGLNVAGRRVAAGTNAFAGEIATFTIFKHGVTSPVILLRPSTGATVQVRSARSAARRASLPSAAATFTPPQARFPPPSSSATRHRERPRAVRWRTIDVGETRPIAKYVTAVYEDVLGLVPHVTGWIPHRANQLDHGVADQPRCRVHRPQMPSITPTSSSSQLSSSCWVARTDDAGLTYWTQQTAGGLT